MKLVDKYRWGNVENVPVSDIEIDSLATLESIRSRQGWMIATQVATIAAISHQTQQTTDALRLVNDTLNSIDSTIQNGFDSVEASIERLESNLIENLNEIKWFLFNVDQKLDQLIKFVKFSGATKSAEFNKQGFILYKIGSNHDAINQLNKSLQENPLNIEAYINLGFVYLREEKLEESILSFEKASKLIKEDFSYFEEISEERLTQTEVFILDNLSILYTLQEKHEDAYKILNQILNKDIDKKTEILTKYKLSKSLCLSGDHARALGVLNELIDIKCFEPVALAVSNPEFSTIAPNILSLLQEKLEHVKNTFLIKGDLLNEKLNLIELEPTSKAKLTDIIYKLNAGINSSSDYSTLLTSEFKERHNDFLNLLELLSELKSRADKELLILASDYSKLEEMNTYNEEIVTDYSSEDGVPAISHKILLSKIKSNAKFGISNTIKFYDNAKKHHSYYVKKFESSTKDLNKISSDQIVVYINNKLNAQKLLEGFYRTQNISNSNKSTENSSETHYQSFESKIIEDYNNLVAKFTQETKTITEPKIILEFDDLNLDDLDELFEVAAKVVVLHQQGSVSLIQRKLNLGYNRAGRIMDQLFAAGIVGPYQGSTARGVLIADEDKLDEHLNKLKR